MSTASYSAMWLEHGVFDEHIQGFREFSNRLGRETFLVLQDLLCSDLSLEIGAHEASYSLALRQRRPSGIKIVAFEGSPLTYRHYSNKIDYKLYNIDYINKVLSDKTGTISFNEGSYEENNEVRSSGMSSIATRNVDDLYVGSFTVAQVDSISGDDFIDSLENYDNISLWIDVEGAQREVLKGFEKSLEKIKSIYIEVETSPVWKDQWLASDVFDFLENYGFVPVLRDFEYASYQYNVIFLKKDLLDRKIHSLIYGYMKSIRDYTENFKKRRDFLKTIRLYLGNELECGSGGFDILYSDKGILLKSKSLDCNVYYNIALSDSSLVLSINEVILQQSFGSLNDVIARKQDVEDAIGKECCTSAPAFRVETEKDRRSMCFEVAFTPYASELYAKLIRSFVRNTKTRS